MRTKPRAKASLGYKLDCLVFFQRYLSFTPDSIVVYVIQTIIVTFKTGLKGIKPDRYIKYSLEQNHLY